MQISIIYDSKKGATKTIVGWMAGQLEEEGHSVTLSKPGDDPELSADLIIIGSPIYFERPLPSVKEFIEKNSRTLKEKEFAVFIVGWAKKVYEKARDHIEKNYFGPLIDPVAGAVKARHMFRGWIAVKDPEQQTEAQAWVNSIIDAAL